MRIRVEHVEKELKRNLLPIYMVSGDEPLLVQEVVSQIRSACKNAGYDERNILNVDRQFDWSSLNDSANSLSLFAEKKLTELRLGNSKPGRPGAKAIGEYCSHPPEDTILIIECGRVDAQTLKSKWIGEIDKIGGIIQVWPISLNEMPKWLHQRAKKLALNLDNEAINLLCDRLEGNLLAAQQELEKLKLLFGANAINVDHVLESVSDSSKYTIFDLTESCLKGNTQLAIKIAGNLSNDKNSAPGALAVISKDIRILLALSIANQKGLPLQPVFKQYRVINRRQAELSQASKRLGRARLMQLLESCKQVDDLMKGVEKGISPWSKLLDIAINLSGKSTTPI